MSFWIVTDAASDLPRDLIEKQQRFSVLPMPYFLDGAEHQYEGGDAQGMTQFYHELRDGRVATTAQVAVMSYQNKFLELAKKGEPIVYVGLSGGLTSSIQSAILARDMVLEEVPKAQITITDSLGASAGEGLLVMELVRARDQGLPYEKAAQWVNDNRQKINHWFTVDDLDFLSRGGRLSKTAALAGGILRIKPVLKVSFEGKLIPHDKVQGRKKSLKELAQKAIERADKRADALVFICHADCEEDALYVKNLIQEGRPDLKDIQLSLMGAIIGSHAGPGTVAVFFVGQGR